jgi:8-oxo-dGTP diphosphatase
MKKIKYCPFCGGNLVRKYIENGNRLFCNSCLQVIYENSAPVCAAIVFDRQDRILLVKRDIEPKFGEWCLPGGFIEYDEDPKDAVLRELKEETNLDGEIENLFEVFSGKSKMNGAVILICYYVKILGGELNAGDDASEVRYFAKSELPELAFNSHKFFVKEAFEKILGF